MFELIVLRLIESKDRRTTKKSRKNARFPGCGRREKSLGRKNACIRTFYPAINLLISGSSRIVADCPRGQREKKRGFERGGRGKREKKRTFSVLARHGRNVNRQWHWGKAYIICIFHEIINIILFYIDRCFNSFSCAMRKDHPAAYERLQGKGEHARDPFQIARTSLLPLFYTVPLYLISWNYFHHRDRWLSIRFCTW